MPLLRIVVSSRRQRHAKPPRQVLHILPGDAAGTGAARRRPFERLAPQLLAVDRDAVAGHIAFDHGEIFVLAAAVKAEPQPNRSDSETFSSTASPGLIAVERSFSTISRASRWRRFEVA